MGFKDINSGEIILKSKHFARVQVDDGKDLAKGIAGLIVRHPKKFIVFLVIEGWIHSLVAHHLTEAKDLLEVLNPF